MITSRRLVQFGQGDARISSMGNAEKRRPGLRLLVKVDALAIGMDFVCPVTDDDCGFTRVVLQWTLDQFAALAQIGHPMMFFVQRELVAHQAVMPLYEYLPSGSFHDAGCRKRARTIGQNTLCSSRVRESLKNLVHFIQAQSGPVR